MSWAPTTLLMTPRRTLAWSRLLRDPTCSTFQWCKRGTAWWGPLAAHTDSGTYLVHGAISATGIARVVHSVRTNHKFELDTYFCLSRSSSWCIIISEFFSFWLARWSSYSLFNSIYSLSWVMILECWWSVTATIPATKNLIECFAL
jgi:hypothetical protein